MIQIPNLSFTQNSEWLAKREESWGILRKDLASGLSRKQLESYHVYFITGQEPKSIGDICDACYIFYYPLQNREGIEYCFQNIFSRACPNENMRQVRLREVLSQAIAAFQEQVPWLTLAERIELFRMYYGESYSPNRKFPFLIGGEEEYREFPLDIKWIWYNFLYVWTDWFRGDQEEVPLHSYLLNYFSSMIPFVSEENLTYKIPDLGVPVKEREDRARIKEIYGNTLLLKEMLKVLAGDKVYLEEMKHRKVKEPFLEELREIMNRLDPSVHPKELIENWQRIKAETGNV